MRIPRSSPLRASVLFLVLASIGGTGCVTSYLNETRRNREYAAEQRRYFADLTQAAKAGDPKARVALVGTLLTWPDRQPGDLEQALAWQTQLAEQGDGPAQYALGSALSGRAFGNWGFMPSELRNREQGIVWLQRAATHGCAFEEKGGRVDVDPALAVGEVLEDARRHDEALAWQGRSIVECHAMPVDRLLRRATAKDDTVARRTDSLALLLLTQDATAIAAAKRDVPADEFAAAEQSVVRLRVRMAAIQHDFPRRQKGAVKP